MTLATVMRHATVFTIFLPSLAGELPVNNASAEAASTTRKSVSKAIATEENVSKRPLPFGKKSSALSTPVFIENSGQFDARVRYQMKIGEQTIWLTNTGITFDATRLARNKNFGSSTVARPVSLNSFGFDARANSAKSRLPKLERLAFAEDFVSKSCCSKIEVRRQQPGIYNYLEGSPANWRTNLRGYSEVIYHDVWSGVDLRIYGNGLDLEQDLIIRAGADLNAIRIAYRGIDSLSVSSNGSLEIKTIFGTLRESKPRIYQEIDGQRVSVNGRFRLTNTNAYTFDVGAHDSRQALVIDPTLLYSTFLGGSAGNNLYTSNQEVATGVAVDASGNAYVVGNTTSTDFPLTPGSIQPSSNSGTFITKLDPTGSALVYSTYLGYVASTSAVTVDSSGQAYVTGKTSAGYNGYTFPTTANAYRQNCTPNDFYITKLNAAGDGLVYSSCFNIGDSAALGAEYGYYPRAITVDSNGRVYVAGGASNGVPITANAYQSSLQGGGSAYLAIFDTTASGSSSLVYGTYLGAASGNADAIAYGVVVDPLGKVYLTGSANNGFPVTPGALQTVHSSATTDVFVAKLDPSLSGKAALIYSTYIGGGPPCFPGCDGGSTGSAITLDSSGSAYVAGVTESPYFPTTPGAFQTTCPGSPVPFVSKLSAGGSQLVYSTCVAGNVYASGDSVGGIVVDSLGDAYIAGGFRAQTLSTFPVTPDAFQSSFSKVSGDYSEAFLTELNPNGSALVYSTYLGGNGDDVVTGLTLDQSGDIYVAGHTSSSNFPVTAGAFQATMHGTGDAFISKFPFGGTLRVLDVLPDTGGNSGRVTLTIEGTGFHAGAVVKLSGTGRDITASSVIQPGGRALVSTFDLSGAPVGPRTVTVSNPDGTQEALQNGFSVQQGGAPNILIQKVGTRAARGHDATYAITIDNIGEIDSSSSEVVELLEPSQMTLVQVVPAPPVPLEDEQNASLIEWPIPTVHAHSRVTLAYTVHIAPEVAVGATVHGSACYAPGLVALNAYQSCVLTLARTVLSCTGCVAVCSTVSLCEDFITCLPSISACQRCLVGGRTGPIGYLGGCGPNAYQLYKCMSGLSGLQCDSNDQQAASSLDPNDLQGTIGVGTERWVSDQQSVSYAISFENSPNASLRASSVVLNLPLDKNLDLSTLQIPLVRFGSVQLSDNSQTVPFEKVVDLRPKLPVLVDVKARISFDELLITFVAIDPLTGLPPVNAGDGFLPPDLSPPEGQGSVIVQAKIVTGIETGTRIGETASIVFDANPPVSTPLWTNAVDSTAPSSAVETLTGTQSSASFLVMWHGTDVGSGIRTYTVYVSDNGGPFAPWQANTTATSATYAGTIGHTYGFYSIATDLVGNVELAKTAAEATTTVQSVSSCAKDVSSQVTVARGGFRLNHATNTFVQTMTLTNRGAPLSNVALVLDSLSTSATLSNAGGTTQCQAPLGSPWIAIPGIIGTGQSVSITLNFSDPTDAAISYRTRVLAGTGQQQGGAK